MYLVLQKQGLTQLFLHCILCQDMKCSLMTEIGMVAVWPYSYVSNRYPGCKVDEFNRMETFIESVGVEIKCNGKMFTFICIYRPPQGNVNYFINVLNENLTIAKDRNYNEIFILGDINLNLLQHNDNEIKDLINLMQSYSLFPLTTLPTRVTATSATLIDHIWSTFVENNIGNFVIKTDITDHFPVVSSFNCSSTPSPPTFITKRTFTQEALHTFSYTLSRRKWSQIMNCPCPNNSYELFYDDFKEIFDSCFPNKTIKINTKYNRSPHITPALKKVHQRKA